MCKQTVKKEKKKKIEKGEGSDKRRLRDCALVVVGEDENQKRNRLTIVEVGTLHLQFNPCHWRVKRDKLTSGSLTTGQ